jgi:hypothetical protein
MLKPTDCNFMFCLPLTKEQFNLDSENLSKHFVREHLPINKPIESKEGKLWNVYDEEVIQPYLKLKRQFSSYGFSFNESVTFSNFIKLIDNSHVNILFSHCKTGVDEAIELFDRLVPKDEFVNAIPLNYNKVLDLSVCKPEFTARELKDKRRDAIVKSVTKSISFMLWLYFYGLAFEIIYKQKAEYYSNAIDQTISKIYS